MGVLTATLASLVALGGAAIAGVHFAGHYFGGAKASAPPAMMAMPVPVAPVIRKTLPIYLDYPGRIELIRSISLQARASGYVEFQPAVDGADVKSGDLLYKIDPRDMQAALDLAKRRPTRTASLDYAKANFARGEELAKSGFVAKDVYEQRSSAMLQAEAALAVDRAAIETARRTSATPKSARLSLAASGAIRRRRGRWSGRRAGRSTPSSSSIRSTSRSTPANPNSPIEQARAAGEVEAEISLAASAPSARASSLSLTMPSTSRPARSRRA